MNTSESTWPSQDCRIVSTQNWRTTKDQLATKAKADSTPSDEFLMRQEDPDAHNLLYAMLLALEHLNQNLTFARAVEYCGTLRLVTHLFFTIWDRAGGLSDTLTDVVAGIVKEGNGLLQKAAETCKLPGEQQKLKEYRASCDFRWQQYRILKEQGRDAVRAFVKNKADAALAKIPS